MSMEEEVQNLRSGNEELHKQIQELTKTEARLLRQNKEIDLQLKKIEALNHFVLTATGKTSRKEILDLGMKTLFSLFPFEQGVCFLTDSFKKGVPVVVRAILGRAGESEKRLAEGHFRVACISPLPNLFFGEEDCLEWNDLGMGRYIFCAREIFKDTSTLPSSWSPEERNKPWAMVLPFHKEGGSLSGLVVIRRIDPAPLSYHERLPSTEDVPFLQLFSLSLQTMLENVLLRQEQTEQVQRLARSNAEFQEFTSAIAHDLKSPLNTIAGFVDLAMNKIAEKELSPDIKKWCKYILESTARLQHMIDDLLSHARLDASPVPLNEVNLQTVFEVVMADLERLIKEQGAVVSCAELPVVTGDRLQLTRLFSNLIGNAIKFHGKASPRIEIHVERENESYLFRVSDNGIGINPCHFKDIFIPFVRVSGHGAHYPGSGMGLAICKKIIDRHKGKIWVESIPDHGSTFFFTLPMMGAE